MRQLNEQQAKFVAYFTGTPGAIGNASEAARRAGYSEKSAGVIGYGLLQKPHIQAAVDQALQALISGALASKAVEVLENIINDPEVAPKLKLDAAKTVLNRSGHIAPKAREPSDLGNAKLGLDDLSTQELQGYIDYLQATKEKDDLAAKLAEDATPRLVGSA